MIKIGPDFCFRGQHGLDVTLEALSKFKELYQEDSLLIESEDYDIVLDTSVVLDLYSISFTERDQMLKFISENRERMIIPKQVESEYLGHRLDALRVYSNSVEDAKETFTNSVNAFNNAKNRLLTTLQSWMRRAIVKKDMSALTSETNKLMEIVSGLEYDSIAFNSYKEQVKSVTSVFDTESSKYLSKVGNEFEDPILNALEGIKVLSGLSDSEKDYLKNVYDKLMSIFNEHKDNVIQKNNYIFPGCGDRKKQSKGFDPYGDFYIYHEILSYMKASQRNCILLTKDVKKSDWINDSGKMYSHYVVDSYGNTRCLLFIIDAENAIPISFERRVEIPDTNDDDISLNNTPSDHQEELSNAAASDKDGLKTKENIASGNVINESELSENRHELYTLGAISKETFMSELSKLAAWSKRYGDNYVSKDYFINSVLADKGYNIVYSTQILESLINDKAISIVQEVHYEKTIDCLIVN